jgi:arylsulfatase A-like enzyme
VFVVTDDQDLLLGGASEQPLPKHYGELQARGTTFENWFVHTPVCCPSRSEILTGRYFHNLALTPINRWDSNPRGMALQCMHINETLLDPAPTFAA